MTGPVVHWLPVPATVCKRTPADMVATDRAQVTCQTCLGWTRPTQQRDLPQRFIVGELSKNWIDGSPCEPSGTLSQQFERMLAVNHERGYRLLSFRLHRLTVALHQHPNDPFQPQGLNETLIAVFEHEAYQRAAPFDLSVRTN